MAFLCLAIVVANTILITLDVGGWLWSLTRLRWQLRGKSAEKRLFRGTLDPNGQAGPALELMLVGHGRGDGKIFFHNRTIEPIFPEGLRLATSDPHSASPVLLLPNNDSWIWPDAATLEQELACPDRAVFEELAPRTERAKGAERSVRVELPPQQTVYIYGSYDSQRGSIGPAPFPLDPTGTPRLIIAGFDPRVWARSQMACLTLGVAATWITFSGLVWLCFQGPAFGPWSQVGALGLLLFFLLVQPFSVFLRERSALPHEVPRNPIWSRARVSSAALKNSAPLTSASASAPTIPANSP